MKITFDSLGRRDKVTSYAAIDGSVTALNDVQFTYTVLGEPDRVDERRLELRTVDAA